MSMLDLKGDVLESARVDMKKGYAIVVLNIRIRL